MDSGERLAAQLARRALERLAVLTLFLTPLLMNPWGQSLCGRIKVSAMWLAAGLAGLLISRLRDRSRSGSWLPSRFAVPGAIWLVVTVVSVVTAFSRVSSAWAAVDLLPGLVLAVAFGIVARRAPARRRMIAAFVGSAAICSLYAVAQHYGLDAFTWNRLDPAKRAAGTIGGPIYLGAFLAMALPFGIALTRVRKPPRWVVGAMVLIVLALVVSYARAGWAAAIAGVVVSMYSAGRAQAQPIKPQLASAVTLCVMLLPVVWMRSHTAAAATGGLVGLFIAWWLATVPGFSVARRALAIGVILGALAVFVDARRPNHASWERISKATDPTSEAASTRHLFWSVATGLIGRRPVTGYGPDGYRVASPTIAHDNVIMPEPLLFPHQNAHSEWYSAAVEGGALGLVAWGAVILSLASVLSDRARREQGHLRQKNEPIGLAPRGATAWRRADVSAAAFGCVAAFVVQGSLTPRAPVTTLGLALCWGMAVALEPRARRRLRVPAGAARFVGVAWCAAATVAFAGSLSADIICGRGEALRARGHWKAAIACYRLASQCNPAEPGYRSMWGGEALGMANARTGMEAMTLAEDAMDAYSTNLKAEPSNGIWRAGMAQALAYINPGNAVSQGRRAVRDAPASSAAWFALSRAYRANGNAYGEKYALRTAIESGPVSPVAFVRLAEVFRNEHRLDLHDRVMGWAADSFPENVELTPWRGKGLDR